MKIILTRHGETEENKEGVLQGWKPGHLSSEGKKQAKLLAERLKDVKIDCIYTSDLRRCAETAKAIAKYHDNARFVKEKALRERGLGEFEGKKTGEADWEALPGNLLTNKPAGGESYGEVWNRIKKFYKKLVNKHTEDTLLVVGHGGSICLLEGIIYGKTFEESMKIGKLKNTAISEFEIDKKGNYKIICRNCEKHLK
jgi:probable phosphoglycerate mutase